MELTADQKRKLWRKHCLDTVAAYDDWLEMPNPEPVWNGKRYVWDAMPKIATPPFPEELRDFTCGAQTRAGTLCKIKPDRFSGRCKWHGGRSTGPITPEGRLRSLENLKLGRGRRKS